MGTSSIDVIEHLPLIAEEEPQRIGTESSAKWKIQNRQDGNHDPQGPADRLHFSDLECSVEIESREGEHDHRSNNANDQEDTANELLLLLFADSNKNAAHPDINNRKEEADENLEAALNVKQDADQSIVFLCCHMKEPAVL